jgi:hypothetical protein
MSDESRSTSTSTSVVATPSQGEPSKQPLAAKQSPAVQWLLRAVFVAVLAGLGYAAYRVVNKQRDPGPFRVGERVGSVLVRMRSMTRVPGRTQVLPDSAHVWTIPLEQGKPYTVHLCSSVRTGMNDRNAISVNLYVHGPGGDSDNGHGHDETQGRWSGVTNHRWLRYAPTSSGVHTIYVYTTSGFESRGVYRLMVVEGASDEAPADLCER